MPATIKSETAVTILMDMAHAADQALGTAAEIEFPASWLDVLHVAQCEGRESETMPLVRFLQHVRELTAAIESAAI